MTGIRKDHFELGIKLSVQGKYPEAAKEYEQVGRSDPNFKQAQLNLKWISYWAGSVSDKFISQDQNRWKPGKKLFSRRLRRRC
ncbi:hypothetical protein MYX84_07855 [Acidobacteria bacterium AH-259-O06]|nr:hypothetical protein [Acidobacteria bacterium AH-259-O06]